MDIGKVECQNGEMKKLTLGSYLKQGRQKARLSHAEVAYRLELDSPLSVLAWERNQGSALPLETLKELIPLYDLNVEVVFDLLLQYQLARLEEKVNRIIKVEL